MPAYMTGKNREQDYFPTAGNQQMQTPQFGLEDIFRNRQQTMQNLRSPMVRRNMSGQVVDENAPTGLDWLAANGPNRPDPLQGQHSWDQNIGSSFDPNEFAMKKLMMEQQGPQMLENGQQFLNTPYGQGMTGGPRNIDAPTGPFLADERAGIQQDLSIKDSMPRQQQLKQPTVAPKSNAEKLYEKEKAVAAKPKPSPVEAAAKFKSQGIADRELARRQGKIQSEGLPEDYYTNPSSPFQKTLDAPSPFRQQSNLSPEQNMSLQAKEAIEGDRPGFIPKTGRLLKAGAAMNWDMLMNLLMRSNADQGYPTTNSVTRSMIQNR